MRIPVQQRLYKGRGRRAVRRGRNRRKPVHFVPINRGEVESDVSAPHLCTPSEMWVVKPDIGDASITGLSGVARGGRRKQVLANERVNPVGPNQQVARRFATALKLHGNLIAAGLFNPHALFSKMEGVGSDVLDQSLLQPGAMDGRDCVAVFSLARLRSRDWRTPCPSARISTRSSVSPRSAIASSRPSRSKTCIALGGPDALPDRFQLGEPLNTPLHCSRGTEEREQPSGRQCHRQRLECFP